MAGPYYRLMELADFGIIQRKALDFIKSRPKVFNRERGINLMRLDINEFNKQVPEVKDSFLEFGLGLTDVLTFVMWRPDHCGIHKDTWHHQARINIPILNCVGSYTYFYSDVASTEVTNALGDKVTVAKRQDIPHDEYVETTDPMVIRVLEFHKVGFAHNHPVPRITLSLGFDVDPVFLLDQPNL